jgi:hypothetical protein
MENKQIICDGCGSLLKNENSIKKRQDGKGYCTACTWIINRNPSDVRTVSKKEFDEILKGILKTPPLRMKDLKTRLKKEREEKKRGSKGSKDSK